MQLAPIYPVTTARLRLRPLGIDDIEEVVAYRSREDVCRYIPSYPLDTAAVTQRLADRWAKHVINREDDAVTLGVELATTGLVIGDVMLHFVSETHRGGEIGWVISPEYAGEGFATEAAHALLHLGFDDLGLHRVIARVDARNTRSLRLGDRLAMRRETYLIENEWFKGAWSDEIDFALLEDEWRGQHVTTPPWCARPQSSNAPNSTSRQATPASRAGR
ncbi:MAG: GNAT family N-acetyltransferase [Acidobacteriaceae bacterium]